MKSIKTRYRSFGFNVAVALLLGLSCVVRADVITLNSGATGKVKERVGVMPGLTLRTLISVNPLLDLDYYRSCFCMQAQGETIAYGYVLFDLSSVSLTANTASIEFDIDYSESDFSNLTVTALTASQAQALSNFPVGTESVEQPDDSSSAEQHAAYTRLAAGFSAIANGPVLGTLADAGPLSDSYTINLNSSVLDRINGAGLFGVGLTWTPREELYPGKPAREKSIIFNSAPSLILSDEGVSPAPTPVPVPLSIVLLGAGLLGVVAGRHIKAQR